MDKVSCDCSRQSQEAMRMKMLSGSVWLNGIVAIIRFLLGYAIPPSHPFLICWEILMMLELPGICLPNDIPAHMALGICSPNFNARLTPSFG